MSSLSERLVEKWRLLKGLDEKHEISRLRLRADIAEGIRDCYTSGMTRLDVAKLLDITPPRVTRLVQGNYRAGEGSITRTPSNYRLQWVEIPEVVVPEVAEDDETPIPAPKDELVCKYCGKEASYRIEWENKSILVCKAHKPPEVDNA